MEIYQEFCEMLHEGMTEAQFWNWAKGWIDVEEMIEVAKNWDEDEQAEAIKEWKAGNFDK